MNPVRKRRLIVVSLVLGAGMVAGSLVALALQTNINYLLSPTEVIAGEAPPDAVFRLGGVVLEESVQSGRVEATREVEYRFAVTDLVNHYPVVYRGVLPDLFREGQSVVAKGRIENNVFMAEEVLAKHDETYMPPEVADKITQARIARAQQLKEAAAQPQVEAPVEADKPAAAANSGAP